MNGKLIMSVLLALMLVGAAVTIVNAQDSGKTTEPPGSSLLQDDDRGRDVPAPAGADDAAIQVEPESPLEPMPVNHTADHDGNQTDGGDGNQTDGGDGNQTDGGDGNQTDGGDGGDDDHGHDDRPSGSQEPPCHCPADEADAAIQKEGEFHDVQEENADRVRFIITVTSVGNTTSFNVGITDVLPDLGTEWMAGGPDGQDCTIDEFNRAVCHLGDMPPGSERVVVFSTYDCEIGCSADGQGITNTATVFADNDRDASNDEAAATLEQPHCPSDVGVRKQGEVALGPESDQDAFDDKVFFFIDIRNFGTGNAYNVTLRDELPGLHGAGWNLVGEDADHCVISQNVLSCDFGTVEPGQTFHLTLESNLCHVQCNDVITNTVTISSDDDSNMDNNEDTVSVSAPECPDVEVQKEATVDDHEHPEHDTVRYTFTVTSVGDKKVLNVVLTDQLFDFGVEWQLSGHDAFDCTIGADNELVCAFGDMRPGETRTLSVVAEACDIGCGEDIVNVATVTSDNDQNSDNDQDDAVVAREPCDTTDPQSDPESQDTGQKEETS